MTTSLAPGTRLGPYEIVSPLGAGGMGEVYRARDTRLDREVAVKVIAAELSASSEQRQRFEREARTISQLSHPHICALFDVGEQDGRAFLVMELLQGETLADRLMKGPLSLEQTLRCGVEIADALDKAHRQGVVHRDLKPGNIMLTKSGVKLLDFGLAKALQPVASTAGTAIETTLSPNLTEAGMFVGTLQYMAPEQLSGVPADARSDIFAFGTVLFEIATGRRAFVGDSRIALASAILNEQAPAPSSVRAEIPRALDRLIRICLAKDPDERWQTAHDVRLQLAAIADDRSGSTMPAVAPHTSGNRRIEIWLPWAFAGVALLAAAAAWLRPRSVVPATSPSVRFLIPPPPGGAFVDSVETLSIALSPDGSQLAYIAADAKGARSVWLRPLVAAEGRPIAGTEGARAMIWSPDGRSIAFFAGDKLKRLDLPDSAPVTLSDVPDVRTVGTWGAGEILFAAVPGGIYRVAASGGAPVVERAPDRAHGEAALVWPWFLPDGRRFLYLVRRPDGSGSVMVAEVGKPGREVLRAVSSTQYVDPGYLVFSRDGTLLAQRFDAATAQTSGEPFPIVEPVRYFLSTGAATFATSRNGVLVYQANPDRGRLVWLDRAGKEVGVVSEGGSHTRVRISPDGRRVLFDRAQPRIGTANVWMVDVERGVEQRVTSDRLSQFGALWLPGVNAALFSGRVPPHIFRKDLTTGAETEVLQGFNLAEDVSPDGRTLAFTQRTANGNFDIWTLPTDTLRGPKPLLESASDEASVRFSRDGRYIAFASDELGRYEVFVMPYPLTGSKMRVSTGGGSLPRWSRDGRELFYISGDRHLMSVPIRTAPALEVGAPQPLFAIVGGTLWADPKPSNGWPDFDVSIDGRRFLANVSQPANEQPLTAVLNWVGAVAK
jgi:eukaryotic-like serine/threonine-protein kinase